MTRAVSSRSKALLTTTQRGYGARHQLARKAALAALIEGAPCHFCRRPMFRWQKLDLDHTVDRIGYRGIVHSSCNRRDGAVRGNRLRGQRSVTRYSRIW